MSKYTQSFQIIKELRITKINIFSNLQNQIGGAGFCFAILAAAFSALPNVIPKEIMESSETEIIPNPLMLVFVIYVVNSLLFAPFSKLNKKNRTKNSTKNCIERSIKMKRVTIILLISLGVVEASGTLSYTIGLQETSATNASILVNSETVFAILLGIMIFKEKLSKKEVLPLILIVLGSILIP
ncbi:MAG: DMT family transporter, partial [Robiginitomaculum sp.]|nr:DMT family transporter [Robiginitomaculum sp.]